MTVYEIISRHAIGGSMVRKGRTTIAPPGAPSSLVATPGDSQISLTWTASPTPGVTYQVRRVNQDTVVWTGSATNAVITGLTNKVTYNFQVYAVDGTGAISTPSNIATAIPASAGNPQVATVFGLNFNAGTGRSISFRQSQFSGRAPYTRIYGNYMVANWPVSTSSAPEKTCVWSYKSGGGFSDVQLANGSATNTMRQMFQSIPANWKVIVVYHHEVNNSSGMEVTPANYTGTYHQMRLALNSATLNSGTQVLLACNFMADAENLIKNNLSTWVPSPADCDLFTWDIYGNPGNDTSSSGSNKYGGPATGKGYGTTYPLPDVRTALMWQITESAGFANNWGILEFNSPGRDWDTNENGRLLWHQDMWSLFQAPPMTGAVPPKVLLMWENPLASFAKWDQSFGRVTGSAAKMVGFWYPLMTGVPSGQAVSA